MECVNKGHGVSILTKVIWIVEFKLEEYKIRTISPAKDEGAQINSLISSVTQLTINVSRKVVLFPLQKKGSM